VNRAVFLDRDGTLIEEKEYLHRPEEVVIFPGVGLALKRLQDLGFKLFVVTNQSGVGRGYFPLEDVHRVHEHLCRELAKDGVRIEKIYIAPEAPDAPSRGRKPSPQFLFDARDEFGIDLAQSYMIGDKLIDLECGWNAGVKRSILVRTGYGAKVEQEKFREAVPGVVLTEMKQVPDWILTREAPLFGGRVETCRYASWQITWEHSYREPFSYRHWCVQEQTESLHQEFVWVVMLNPGSMDGRANRLPEDRTLGRLRLAFDRTGFRCLILNLFDRATPMATELFRDWNDRGICGNQIAIRLRSAFPPRAIIFAYGSHENSQPKAKAELLRLAVQGIRQELSDYPEINGPLNRSGTPKHPCYWSDLEAQEVSRQIQQVKQKDSQSLPDSLAPAN
jgi:D-glycero-D-manno-heptose 1,7-bisphosphate phosphatase